MGSVVNSNSWVSFLTHGFSGKNNGNANYSPTDIGLIEDALKYAQQNDKDIWVAPMGHVAMYIKERKAAKIEASGSGTITVKLTHNIKDNISDYDYPLSIRVKYDGSKAEVTQAGAKLESKIDGGYVYFDAVPNAGDIVISAEGGTGPTPSSSDNPVSSSSGTVSSSSNPGRAIRLLPVTIMAATTAVPLPAQVRQHHLLLRRASLVHPAVPAAVLTPLVASAFDANPPLHTSMPAATSRSSTPRARTSPCSTASARSSAPRGASAACRRCTLAPRACTLSVSATRPRRSASSSLIHPLS
jgi:hypothetical protein